MDNALEVVGLRKEYPGFTLDGLSFVVPTGHVMGFVGQNGAGKTTTLRLILNMARRNGGEIRVLGMDNVAEEWKVKQDVAVVFDEIPYVETWRVREVGTALKPFYDRWSGAAFARYVKEFELPPERQVKDLSRGMKLKLMLAAALSHEAKLLILDEPTSGLDPVARDELLELLSACAREGTSVLFSTHITSDLEKIADDVTMIHKGRLVYTGTKAGLIEGFRGRAVAGANGAAGAAGAAGATATAGAAPTLDEILVAVSKGVAFHA